MEVSPWQKRKKRKVKKTRPKKKLKRKPHPRKKAKREGKAKKRNRKIIRPQIDATAFGSITIEGREIENDVILRLDGSIEKRKKKLSKSVYGTSHTISRHEVKYIHEKGAKLLIIGTGQYGRVALSDEAGWYLKSQQCRVKLEPTSEAIQTWNMAKAKTIGLFHVTC